MDWIILKDLNHFAVAHDLFEDPLTSYVRSSQFLFVGLVAILFLLAGRNRYLGARAAVAALGSCGLALAVGQVVAGAVDRPRPYLAHPGALHLYVSRSTDPSFPSDHATAAFAIAVAIFLRNRRWGIAALIMASVLAAGRIFVGAHYPSDVIAGAALGSAAALFLRLTPIGPILDRIADKLASGRDAVYRRLPIAQS